MLKLIGNSKSTPTQGPESAEKDHQWLLDSYFQSHRIRNHSVRTIDRERQFLGSWFAREGIYTWEAMKPVEGRDRLKRYGEELLKSEVTVDTIRSYLGILRRYFSYVLEYPFIVLRGGKVKRIQDAYGSISQAVTEWDIPHYAYDGERQGVPLDPERLYDFYAVLRETYLKPSGWKSIRARNYTMVVVAGESGLRVDELLSLEISHDLFFESHKLQTRHAKGTKGSGKRARITLFPPLARDTVRYYIEYHRPKLCHTIQSDSLFISQQGARMTYKTANQALHEMVETAQKQEFQVASHLQWHWLRRVFATRFIERFPTKLSVLIELLGHVSPNTVHKYIRHSEAWMDRQIQAVLEGAVKWPSIGD